MGPAAAGSFAWSCYSILDRGQVPPPVEDASESAWREFDACWESLDRQARETSWGPAPHVDDLMRLARTNDRVCPMPAAWMRMQQLLRVLGPARATDPAPAALDRAAWNATTDLQKRLRLREQLAWAQHHGGLHVANEFLRALREDDWHHHTPLGWPSL